MATQALEVKTAILGTQPSGVSILSNIADTTALIAIETAVLATGSIAQLADGSMYYFSATASSGGLTPTSGGGQWTPISDGSEVSVKNFGAKGDGVTDDTEAIQKSISYSALTSIPVFIPSDMTCKVTCRPASNAALTMASNSHIRIDGVINLSELVKITYEVFRCWDISNFIIEGRGTINGDRTARAAGEWGHVISICGCNKFTVKNVTLNNAYGDNLYLGSTVTNPVNTNGIIDGITCDNSRRNGISLISGENIRFLNVTVTDVNGTSPEAGMDIEPDSSDDKISNIVVENLRTYNCAGKGLMFALSALTAPASVDIINHYDKGSYHGLYVFQNSLIGIVNILCPVWENTIHGACYINTHSYTGEKINIISPSVINCNTSGGHAGLTDSAFIISNSGNIHISNPSIKSNQAYKCEFGLYTVGANVKNNSFLNPTSNDSVNLFAGIYAWDTGNILEDKNRVFSDVFPNGFAFPAMGYGYSYVNNLGATAFRSFTLPLTTSVDFPTITFENKTIYNCRIFIGSGETMYGVAAAGTYITSGALFDTATFKRVTGGWQLVSRCGSWVGL